MNKGQTEERRRMEQIWPRQVAPFFKRYEIWRRPKWPGRLRAAALSHYASRSRRSVVTLRKQVEDSSHQQQTLNWSDLQSSNLSERVKPSKTHFSHPLPLWYTNTHTHTHTHTHTQFNIHLIPTQKRLIARIQWHTHKHTDAVVVPLRSGLMSRCDA